MRKIVFCFVLGLLCLGLHTARGQDTPATGAASGDQLFVMKASANDLAEVNLGRIAVKRAGNADVKKFAQKMIDDHTKTSKELLALANKKRMKPAATMEP